uniref:Uncharacterized protein n=1 Tax=Siphoviridae sp. ctg4a4 TaxID=2825602 RepID=A0A8S5V5K5_9CAUD|nr:MAG TPA: hypothetical protein [Siphoviridae sp. ctg4a4]
MSTSSLVMQRMQLLKQVIVKNMQIQTQVNYYKILQSNLI